MITILNSIYKKITLSQFKIYSILICLCADILFFIFIKTYLIKPDKIKAMMLERDQFKLLPSNELSQWVDLLINQIINMITIYFVINFIFYILFYFEKKWAVKYISQGTAFMGIIFSVVTVYEALQFSYLWAIVMIALIPLYVFVWKGCRHFFRKQGK